MRGGILRGRQPQPGIAAMTTMASFEIAWHQYLDANGVAVRDMPGFAHDAARLLELYRSMLRTRLFDRKAVALQRTGQMGTYASSLGQEATAAGVGAAMRREDVFLPTYREQGVYLARGVTMAELLLYWGGDECGMAFAGVPDDFPVAIPIATHLPHAVGVAWAFQYRKQARVAVGMCGDGATSKGDFYEAINAAGVWQLPCVFVVVNNGWAISMPRAQQSRCETLAQKAIAAGIPGEQVDGNDVIAVFDRVGAALERARSGGGPTLVETLSYRVSDHTTADDATRYRSEEEVRAQAARDPIDRLRRFMVAAGVLSETADADIKHELELELESAVAEYLATPPRGTRTMFDCLYAELPDALASQREECLREYPDDG